MPRKKRAQEEVDIYGNVYSFNIPTVLEALDFHNEMRGVVDDEENLEVTIRFFKKLGLPKKATYELELKDLEELIDDVLGYYKKVDFMDWQMAKVANFYGWTHKYISSMDARVFTRYFKAIEPIEAQDQLKNFTAHDWSNFKKETRKELFGKLSKIARSVFPKKKVKFTKELLESIVNQYKP